MATVAIDYTPAIRQQAGIGRLIRGQIAALIAANPGLDLRLFVAGRVDESARRQAPLPLHTTPLDERNMVRLWHRLGAPLPRVSGLPAGRLTSGMLLILCAEQKPGASADPRPGLSLLPRRRHAQPASLPERSRARSVRRADALIADSQHTANDLNEQWRVPPACITVVREQSITRTSARSVTQRSWRARQRYGLGERPYILALSRLEPRKNFVRLIDAFAAARAAVKLPHCLVIGGRKGWLYESIFARGRKNWAYPIRSYFPALSRTPTCLPSTAVLISSPILPCMKDLGCRSSRRWPAVHWY